jgi:RNA polymerase sigma-70 factor (ECF subfamily)
VIAALATGGSGIGWEAHLGLWEGAGVDSEAARLRRGEPDALVALLEKYQHRLYRYLLRIVHQPATAEDLFQQTWIRVAENAKRFDPNRGIEPWLFSIARNLAIDYLRRVKPESLDETLPSGTARVDMLADEQPAVLETLMVQQRSSRLAEAIGELSPMYREVITLRFEEDMKLEEIAALTEMPLSTVKTRLRRGLDALRELLAARLPGGELPGRSNA